MKRAVDALTKSVQLSKRFTTRDRVVVVFVFVWPTFVERQCSLFERVVCVNAIVLFFNALLCFCARFVREQRDKNFRLTSLFGRCKVCSFVRSRC